MSGVAGYVSPGHVPSGDVQSNPGLPGYNLPHVNEHNNISDMLDLVEAAVPTGLADLGDDVDTSTFPSGALIALCWNGTKWVPTVITAGGVVDLSGVTYSIVYDPVDGWALRATVTTDTSATVFYLDFTGSAPDPTAGSGNAIDGQDVFIQVGS